ncbi:TPA: hypothetical protein JI227_11080 [Acinetobacter baumannii]|nr:hypothetical protein [Acinetobacter baumannii]
MIYEVPLSQNDLRFQTITPDKLADHSYLDENDNCFYFGEYTARASFSHSQTNNIISNFKKSVDRKGLPEWKYKTQAIEQVANILNGALNPISTVLFVPVPPSKTKDHPLYDDRMIQVLKKLNHGWMDGCYRELVVQINSTDASHQSDARRDVQKLIQNYRIDQNLLQPVPETIIIIDDVLTTGCHYKAVKYHLEQAFPSADIYGLFIARRKIEE